MSPQQHQGGNPPSDASRSRTPPHVPHPTRVVPGANRQQAFRRRGGRRGAREGRGGERVAEVAHGARVPSEDEAIRFGVAAVAVAEARLLLLGFRCRSGELEQPHQLVVGTFCGEMRGGGG